MSQISRLSSFVARCAAAAMPSLLAVVAAGVVAIAPSTARAQQAVEGWIMLPQVPAEFAGGEAFIRPKRGQTLLLDRGVMAGALAEAPMENTPGAANPVVVIIPTPDGRPARFAAVESPTMEPALAAAFPQIKSYWARGIDDPTAVARFDLSPLGFRAQVIAPEDGWSGGTYYIDPYTRGDDLLCTSYYRRDLGLERPRFTCLTPGADGIAKPNDRERGAINRSGATRRTFRLAVICTGEYGSFFGSAANALAAINTGVNRVTGIYEIDFTVRLTLVANNNLIVYTNPATDPFTNTGDTNLTFTQAATAINSAIGSANYDVGHIFDRGGGGVAALGSVCSASKASGYSSADPPTGDPFHVDYVAHEIGHQFSAPHPFNNCGGGPGGAFSDAYEPGSGSTIMAYAGICGAENLASNSDPDFHASSIDYIVGFVETGGGAACDIPNATGNSPPVVTVTRRTYNIPASTPFFLTASATDPNGNALTYDWDQMDSGGAAVPIPLPGTNTVGPTFRSFPATASPTRYFPRLSNLVANTLAPGERLPSVARTMNFRCLVRDGVGGVSDTRQVAIPNEIQVITTATGAPFTVTAPNTAVVWSGVRSVTWNVAGTTAAPISCSGVDILLSTDGGLTYPTTLATNVPNTGTASITLPSINSSTARIMVRGNNNIFFDISNVNFTIQPPPAGVSLTGTGVNTFTDNTGNGNANSVIDPGENNIRITVGVVNNGTSTATGVVGTLTSLTATATVTTATANYPNLAGGASANNTTPYVISISPSHPCGSPISLRVSLASAQAGPATYNFSLPTGGPGAFTTQTFTYSTPVVAIPDAPALGVNVNLPVSGVTGTVTKVVFRINGTTCNATAGSTTVGLNHTWVGDLDIALTNPAGTRVVLMDNPGGTGNGGNNFCNTILDDAGASSIQSITAAGNPWSGTFTPANPLSAFNGQNANGTWVLNLVDTVAQDTGSIRNFSVVITSQGPPVCTPPNNAGCPVITGQPQNQLVCAGDPATFTVVATGTSLTYDWRRNGTSIGAPSLPTLSIGAASASNAGSYTCVISNSCNTVTSNAATLTLRAANDPACANPCEYDYNQDENVDLTDAQLMAQVAAGLITADPSWLSGDLNNDENADLTDAQILAQYVASGVCPV
jgi:subtilisin-like proprotein convertase family protein